jgi:hypothetical protein
MAPQAVDELPLVAAPLPPLAAFPPEPVAVVPATAASSIERLPADPAIPGLLSPQPIAISTPTHAYVTSLDWSARRLFPIIMTYAPIDFCGTSRLSAIRRTMFTRNKA